MDRTDRLPASLRAKWPVISLLILILAPSAAADRILFIGNSLTYANNLPGMVCALAAAAGRELTCESVVRGGFSLEDHWNDGAAVKRIREGGWTWVVLQQGPSAADDSRRLLLRYVSRFDREIRRQGARTVIYQVWPSLERSGDFDRSLESYRLAADASKGILVPAGKAIREALASELPVLDRDRFHPSVAGSYLGALAFHHALWGAMPSSDVVGFDKQTRATMSRCLSAAFD